MLKLLMCPTELLWAGSLYETKIQSDLDEELMGLLPLGSGGEHEYGDLIRS